MSEQVRVELDHEGRTRFVGTAYFHIARGPVATTFKYSDDYLAERWAFPISPELSLSTAPFSVSGLPGAFDDCAPDRWGRNLVAKAHRRQVADGSAPDRRLTEVDYLLGVSDATRQGALRFRADSGGEFLGASAEVPKLLSLPQLQRAADEVEEGSAAAIKRLLDAGTGSLGGARPKASVAGEDGRLMIAKFSRHNDATDVIAWEALALELARRAGILVPKSRLLRIDDRPILVLDRFDRVSGLRRSYMSAMTASGRHDGEPGDYIDLVEAIEDESRQWRRDCAELFRRVVLSVAIHNTDDHLRNHGFVRTAAGWQLSPVFDINPEPDPGVERQTAVNGVTDPGYEAEALLEFAPLCHLKTDDARAIMTEVAEAAGTWRASARSLMIAAREWKTVGATIDRQVERIRAVASPIH